MKNESNKDQDNARHHSQRPCFICVEPVDTKYQDNDEHCGTAGDEEVNEGASTLFQEEIKDGRL